jgi:formate hydrogenlyase subunit 3/multisubunit Na+/H+ antiporter MnhD subunit
VTALDVTRNALKWILPITAIATLALVVLGLAAHPERGALFKSLGLGLLLLAVMVALLGYVVPKWVIPALSDSPWAGVPAALADDSLAMLVGLELLLVGAALALLAGTGAMRRRQRWSTPVSTYRYQDERRWS